MSVLRLLVCCLLVCCLGCYPSEQSIKERFFIENLLSISELERAQYAGDVLKWCASNKSLTSYSICENQGYIHSDFRDVNPREMKEKMRFYGITDLFASFRMRHLIEVKRLEGRSAVFRYEPTDESWCFIIVTISDGEMSYDVTKLFSGDDGKVVELEDMLKKVVMSVGEL